MSLEAEREKSRSNGLSCEASLVRQARAAGTIESLLRKPSCFSRYSKERIATLLVGCLLGIFQVVGLAAEPSPGVVTRTDHGDALPVRKSPSSKTHLARPTRAKHTVRKKAHDPLGVRSKIALVEDASTSQVLYSKQPDAVVPIASITKLMTAMVVLDAHQPMSDSLKIADADVDRVKFSTSRLHVGWALSREDMLHLALMSSENRAASALGRYYPGGLASFLKAMNAKARELGMDHTHFISPNGLTSENVSTASDLVKLVKASYQYPLIREFSTDTRYDVRIGRHVLPFNNTNRLVGRRDWDIEIQKTGYIRESGDCLVMQANIYGRELIMVFLDAYGKLTRFADARRVKLQLASVIQTNRDTLPTPGK